MSSITTRQSTCQMNMMTSYKNSPITECGFGGGWWGYLSRRKRRYSEQSCWEPALNHGGREDSKKFLGAYAALWREHTHITWYRIAPPSCQRQEEPSGLRSTHLCVGEEGKEQLQLLHQHVGTAEMERQDMSPETETQRVAVNPFHKSSLEFAEQCMHGMTHILFILI